MTVSNGQLANETTFNNSFVSRLASQTDTVALVDLLNASTTQLIDLQRVINEALASLGVANQAATDANANVYSSNNVILDGDDRKVAIGKLDAEFEARFNVTTGHNHDGVNSAALSIDDISGFNSLFAEFGEFTFDAASGTSIDVSSLFTGKTSGGDAVTAGVITSAPNNYVSLLEKTTGGEIEDADGDRVFGRITESGGTWTLSFFTNEAGVETAHSLSSQDIRFLYREVYTAGDRPTIGANVAVYDTQSAVGDIPDATATQRGVVSTGAQTFAGGKDFTTRPTVNAVDVVDLDATQTLTNKTLTSPVISTPDLDGGTINDVDFDGGTATNTSRVTLPKESTANLTALTRKEGTVFYDTDEQNFFGDNGTDIIPLGGGGGGGGDRNFDPNGDASVADDTLFTATGLAFSISQTASELIDGPDVFKAVATAASETIKSPNIEVPQGRRGRRLVDTFEYKMLSTDDWTLTIRDETNAFDIITETVAGVVPADNTAQRLELTYFVRSDCEEISYTWTSTAASTLLWDDHVVSDEDPSISETQIRQTFEHTAVNNTLLDRSLQIRFDLSNINESGDGILAVTDDPGNSQTTWTALRKCTVHVSWNCFVSGNSTARIDRNGSRYIQGSVSGSASTGVHATLDLDPGDTINVVTDTTLPNNSDPCYLYINAVADEPSIVTTTDNVQPVRYSSNSGQSIPNNTSTIVNFEDRDFDLNGEVTTGGSWQYLAPRKGTLSVNACIQFTTASSAVATISVFKNGVEQSLLDRQNMSFILSGSDLVAVEKGDIIDVRAVQGSGVSTSLITSSEFNYITIEYVDKKAISSAPLISQIQIKDFRLGGSTGGGASGANTLQTRQLNTVEGIDSSLVTLSSNQFTLPAGSYYFDISAPAYAVDDHVAFLYNVTDATYDLEGQVSNTPSSGAQASDQARVTGSISIDSAKTFEIRHLTQTARANNGLGNASSANLNHPTGNDTYTTVDIFKLR